MKRTLSADMVDLLAARLRAEGAQAALGRDWLTHDERAQLCIDVADILSELRDEMIEDTRRSLRGRQRSPPRNNRGDGE
jgi:hypothetical protein